MKIIVSLKYFVIVSSLLGTLLTGKCTTKVGEETIRTGQNF